MSYKQVLSENEYQEAREKYGSGFRVGMGAESILELLHFKIPDMRYRRSQFNMPHTFPSYACFGDLNPASVADNTLIPDANSV